MSWLEELKPGDKVALSRGLNTFEVATVSRVMKSQVEVNGDKYRKSDGQRVGDNQKVWFAYVIKPLTEKMITDNKRRELGAFLRNLNWEGYPLETLEAAYALVKQAQEPGK